MLVFALFHRVGSRVSGGCVLAVSLVASYGAALLVNAARITIARPRLSPRSLRAFDRIGP
jgi:hypothetical protein